MILAWWRRRKARIKHEKQIQECREDGHFLVRSGELTPATMKGGAPVPTGKPDFWLFSCKCGYSEVNDVGTVGPYRRTWDDGEHLKKTASIGYGITEGGQLGKK